MISDTRGTTLHDRWAELRFAIVGPLLAAPPARGELGALLEALSKKVWVHPATGEPVSFGAPTIERWYYQARAAGTDRVGALRKRIRKDAGTHRAIGPALAAALREQYEAHSTWSYQLHADNLVVLCEQDSDSAEAGNTHGVHHGSKTSVARAVSRAHFDVGLDAIRRALLTREGHRSEPGCRTAANIF